MRLIAMKYSCKDTEQWGLESRRMKIFPKISSGCKQAVVEYDFEVHNI